MSKAIKSVTKSVGGFLGISGPDTQAYGGPSNYYTPYSSVVGGQLTLDPSIRKLQDEGLNRTNAIYGDVGNATDRFISSIRDNQNGYIAARVNPVLKQFGTLRDTTQQKLGMRGLSGSSFADQSMRNIATDAATAEGDARALATQEVNQDTLNAVFQRATLQAGLNNENYQVATARLQQELASLGLDASQIGQAMQAWAQNQQNYLTGYAAQSQRIGTIGKIFNDATSKGGALASGFGA